jgi:hypothetical protein
VTRKPGEIQGGDTGTAYLMRLFHGDRYHVRLSPLISSVNLTTPLFRAKLRAFAHFHLNMFEIVLNERPSVRDENSLSIIWFRYFDDTLNKSKTIRDVLEEKNSPT